MLVPLRGSQSQNHCGAMRAAKEYVSWILSNGDALAIASRLMWATMSLKISQTCTNILEQMTCNGCGTIKDCRSAPPPLVGKALGVIPRVYT